MNVVFFNKIKVLDALWLLQIIELTIYF